MVRAWSELAPGISPTARGTELAVQTFLDHGEVSRELAALRAVQSLSVLDIRNYRRLVFKLGGYAGDGEDPALGRALP